jgi:hypothetical protein
MLFAAFPAAGCQEFSGSNENPLNLRRVVNPTNSVALPF